MFCCTGRGNNFDELKKKIGRDFIDTCYSKKSDLQKLLINSATVELQSDSQSVTIEITHHPTSDTTLALVEGKEGELITLRHPTVTKYIVHIQKSVTNFAMC